MFVLKFNILNEICKCLTLVSDKTAKLGFSYNNKILYMFAVDYQSAVEYLNQIDEQPVDFDFGVDLGKFLSICKKLYNDNVCFTVKTNKLIIQQGNMIVNLPITEPLDHPIESDGWKISIDHDRLPWIVDGITRCNASVVDSTRFKGIMVDICPQKIKIGKFSGGTVTIVKGDFGIPECNERFVISPDLVNVLQSFKDRIESMAFSNNLIRINLKNGVIIKFSLLNDDFPKDYIKTLELVDENKLIDESGYEKYVFDRDELYAALDVVLVVAESKKTFVDLETMGFEEKTGLMVWKASCRSSDGCLVEEKFKCSEICSDHEAKFGISGPDLINFLRVSDEVINLYNNDNKPIVVSDSIEQNVTLLIKTFKSGGSR